MADFSQPIATMPGEGTYPWTQRNLPAYLPTMAAPASTLPAPRPVAGARGGRGTAPGLGIGLAGVGQVPGSGRNAATLDQLRASVPAVSTQPTVPPVTPASPSISDWNANLTKAVASRPDVMLTQGPGGALGAVATGPDPNAAPRPTGKVTVPISSAPASKWTSPPAVRAASGTNSFQDLSRTALSGLPSAGTPQDNLVLISGGTPVDPYEGGGFAPHPQIVNLPVRVPGTGLEPGNYSTNQLNVARSMIPLRQQPQETAQQDIGSLLRRGFEQRLAANPNMTPDQQASEALAYITQLHQLLPFFDPLQMLYARMYGGGGTNLGLMQPQGQ